jgi:hypothetical protein
MRQLILLTALTLATVSAGHAATITFTGTSNVGFTFDYSMVLSNHNQYLFTNDGFTIYDFFGPLSFVTPNASWQVGTQLNAPGTPNDGTRPDVTFTYLGAPITGPAELDFSITSSSNFARSDDAILAFHKKQGQSIVPDTKLSSLTVAGASAEEAEAVPEPSAVTLTLTGLLLLACSRRRK